MDNRQERIRLLALDLDGTLFNTEGKITPASVQAICRAQEKGVHVVLASGRDYDGMPWEQLTEVPIEYAVTTNGSAVYSTKDRACLCEECLDQEKIIPILEYLLEKEVYISIFFDGVNYTPISCFPYVENLDIPEYVREALRENRNGIEDLVEYIKKENVRIQKVTLNFQKSLAGGYLNREEVREYLKNDPNIQLVDGGFANLEFAKAGVSKALGLTFLAGRLQIPMEQVMAIGDSENDIEMIETVGLGIAMGNALEHVKEIADDVTETNEKDGVAYAIEKYIVQNQ